MTNLATASLPHLKIALDRLQLDIAVLEERRRPVAKAKWGQLKRMETILQFAIYQRERDK